MLTGVAIISFIYIGYLATLYRLENKLIFIGSRPNYLKYEALKESSEDIMSGDNKLQGWKLDGARKNSNSVIIYFGGNAQDVALITPILQQIDSSYIYTFNYRGYGLSEGVPGEDFLYNDSINIFKHVKENNPGKNIILVGQSLGTAIAGYLATQKAISGLILISPLSSIYKIAREKLYYSFPKALLQNNFDLYENAKYINSNTLVVIAENDTIIPTRHSIATYDQISSNKELLKISSADHNDIFSSDETIANINEFIKK